MKSAKFATLFCLFVTILAIELPNYQLTPAMEALDLGLDFWDHIHPSSAFDYSKIEQIYQQSEITEQIQKATTLQVLSFPYNSSLETAEENKLLKLEQFTTKAEVTDYMSNLKYSFLLDEQVDKPEFYLALELAANSLDQQVREAEYLHFD